MGILFRKRPRMEDISGLNPLERYAMSQIRPDNKDIYDDPQPALDYIRKKIALGPPTSIKFVVDQS